MAAALMAAVMLAVVLPPPEKAKKPGVNVPFTSVDSV